MKTITYLGPTPAIFVLFLLLTAAVRGEEHVEFNNGVLEINDWQGPLQIGTYAYLADVPRSHLNRWFSSPGDVLTDIIENIPESTLLTALPNRLGSGLTWRRNAKNKLFLDAPSQLSLVAIDLVYRGSREKDLLLDMSHVDGIAWQYRDDQGNPVRHADDFGKLWGAKPVIDPRAIIPLHFKPDHRYRLYIAAYTVTEARHAWMDLWNAEELRAERWQLRLVDGIYFGLILALILYNLFLFVALRQYAYLCFALFVTASAGLISIASGMALMFIAYPLALPLVFLCQGLVQAFGALFSMSLLNIRHTNSVLYHLWIAVAGLSIASTAIIVYMAISRHGGYSPDPINATLYIAASVWIVYQIANLCTLVYYWHESRIARYWFVGITVHTWSLAIYPILLNTSTDLFMEPYHLAQLATVFDTILLSALIAYSFRSEKDLRVQAQHKSVENLRLALDLQRTKSRFVATVGHELRGPVQAISFFVQSLKGTLPGKSQTNLQKIDQNIASISELLDSLIRLSATDGTAPAPVPEKVSLSKLFATLRTEFEARAAEKDVSLEFDATRCVVQTDRVGLGQILRNLIDNAIKYTDAGRVRVRVEEEHDRVRISVEDTGHGIADDELSNIFDEFYRISGQDADPEGVGLGLSIVKRLTNMLGIEMTVRSTPHEGSSFELTIDKQWSMDFDDVPSVSRAQDDSVKIVPPTSGTLCELKILMVGANGAAMDSISGLLREWNTDLHHCHSFGEAADFMVNQPWRPDLVICESVAYRVQESASNGDPTERLIGGDVPVFVVDATDESCSPGAITRKNHILIPALLQPMKFRSLIQRHVRVAVANNWRPGG